MTMFDDEDAAVAVSAVFRAVGQPNRVRILDGLYRGRSRAELVDALPISGSGVTNHLRTLEDADLVVRGKDGDWRLSPLGRFMTTLIAEDGESVVDAVEQVAAAEEEARNELADVPLTGQELERAVARRKWELAADDLDAVLATGDDADSTK